VCGNYNESGQRSQYVLEPSTAIVSSPLHLIPSNEMSQTSRDERK
jgi:hypothetical protein